MPAPEMHCVLPSHGFGGFCLKPTSINNRRASDRLRPAALAQASIAATIGADSRALIMVGRLNLGGRPICAFALDICKTDVDNAGNNSLT
jgi:hypothetical protein